MSLRQSIWSAVLILGALVFAASPLRAQSCTADAQCPDGGRSRTFCAGNALVTARSVCTGTCRSVEERRAPCAGTCAGDRCIDTAGRGHAEAPSAWPRCSAGCRCANKILIITTGRWSPASGCEQLVRRCARGCTCDDAPRCR